MEVKVNVNRVWKISQITPLHLEVSSSFIAKVQAEITYVKEGEMSSVMMQLYVY